MSKAIIIGAGIAGIAAAIRLAIKGHQVEVFEASAQAGRKAFRDQAWVFSFRCGTEFIYDATVCG
jgi:phytoene desaturase